MYYIDVDSTNGLEHADLVKLSAFHKLRPDVLSIDFLPIASFRPGSPQPGDAMKMSLK